jgi:uncharacterized protein (TIGR02996 family)
LSDAELLAAVLREPDAVAPRLRYAEALEARHDPRGELIRVQCALAAQDQPALRERERALLSEHRARWVAPLEGIADQLVFRRGFVEHLVTDASRFLREAERLFALEPVQHLDLTQASAAFARFVSSPWLARLRSLSVRGCGIGNSGAGALAKAPGAAGLRWLDLSKNGLSREGVEALAASAHLSRCRWLDLGEVDFDPREEPSIGSGGEVAFALLPEIGRQLEQRYGRREWFHIPDGPLGPPDRYAL